MLHVLTLLAALSSAPSDTPAPPQPAPQPPPEPIAVGTVVEREVKAKDVHRYSIDLRDGEYFQSVVEQSGTDVSQTLSGPDGGVLLEVDSFSANQGPDPVAFVAPAAGRYLLAVQANDDEPGARYVLRVVAVREPAAEDLVRVDAVRNMAELSRLSGTPAQGRTALEHGRRAAQAWRELGERRMEMYAEEGIGFIHRAALAEYKEARPALERALAIARDIQELACAGRLHYNLGETNARLGRFAEAHSHYQEALTLHRASKRRDKEGYVLMALARALIAAGDPQQGLDRLEQSLGLYETIGDLGGFPDPRGMAQLYMGNAYVELHDYELALTHYRASQPALSRHKTLAVQAWHGIGAASFGAGSLADARAAYGEALKIYRELGVPGLEADTSLRIGEIHREEGDLRGAETLFAAALGVFRSREDPIGQSRAQCRLGEVRLGLGEREAARTALEAALAAAPAENASLRACAELGLARLALDEGALPAARARAEAALAAAESLRASVAAPRARSATLEVHQAFYEALIEIRTRQHEREPLAGHAAAALEISERARARTLLELLAEGRVEVHEGVDASLVTQARLLRDQLNAAARAQEEAQASRRPERAEALGRDIVDLTGQLAEAQGRIRRSNPRYAALSLPQPLDADVIRREVLDADTILLEYALGERRSHLWIVSNDVLLPVPLAPRLEIEAAARRLHETTAGAPVHGRPGSDAVAELSALVLPPSAWAALDRKRLLIVAPGALQYVPFAALRIAGEPLLARFELVSAPSASVVGSLRREQGRAARTVAAFADPVFDLHDPRVPGAVRSGGRPPEGPPAAVRALRSSGRGALTRLPFSRREAEAVRDLAPPGTVLYATGFDANRKALIDAALSDYRILHLATHGILNTRQPDLSGIVLSLVDPSGRPQDGFLRLHDIYNLRLNADLVVLSACQTALGKDMRGEGLIGLTRGFMYAGARSVVASLWKVDDESTAELMKRFYRGLLKENRRPADALRAAQLEMSRERRWSAPFYWAGFALQGDWR